MLYPLLFEPILKEKIWGGDALFKKYGIKLPSSNIGENWSIACHKNGMSIVLNGHLKGKSLYELIELYGRKLLGNSLVEEHVEKFPLLVKFLDAADTLSVQVHPNDAYAKVHENGELGKTEMWYIIDAKPGASLVYGVKKGTSKEEFRAAIEGGYLEKYLRRLEVEAGDVVFIPAGMVHAIGAGILICEIQQNSDTTYRVYDWNRVGIDGKPRSLHIDKALDVIDFEGKYDRDKLEGLTVDEGETKRTYYIATKYFAIEKLTVKGQAKEHADGSKFYCLSVVEGSGSIMYNGGSIDFKGGKSVLIPANLGHYTIEGDCIIIKAYIPEIEKDIVLPLLDRGYSREELSSIVGL